jgi:CubicO group peptidase (beta-lactamase class C family)
MLTDVEQELQRTSPEQQGVASSAVLAFIEALDNQIHDIHGFVLLRHGNVIAEGWWSPYQPKVPHMLFSVSKSFTSTAVGLAVSEGYFSIDDPVISFFPDDLPSDMSDNLAAMRVRHLLTMSTGHDAETIPPMVRRPDLNWVKGFFDAPVVHEPGTQFLYNTGATYMLSAIVQKTTGMKLTDYLQPRLFEPLGIKSFTWPESPQGIIVGGFGLSITTEDIARFGQLYLQKGQWHGHQLIPEAWIEQATSFQISNGDPATASDWAQGYGFQFWRCQHNGYRGDGAFGQYCLVLPEQDIVLAITSGLGDMQQPLNLVWEILLPAISDEALPEDPEAHKALVEKLTSLSLPPVQSQVEASESEASQSSVSGRVYKVDDNPFNIETLKLDFDNNGCTVTITTPDQTEVFPSSDKSWLAGESSLFNEIWVTTPQPVMTSGAWMSADHFQMVIRLVSTAYVYTLDLHFSGDDLTITAVVNVSFEPIQPVTMTAHAQ